MIFLAITVPITYGFDIPQKQLFSYKVNQYKSIAIFSELPYTLYIGRNFFISPSFSQIFQNNFKGVIFIDIEIKKCSRIKTLLHKTYDILENLLFALITKLPESIIPKPIMTWLNCYANKRIAKLQQQIIRDRWRSTELDKLLQQLNNEK